MGDHHVSKKHLDCRHCQLSFKRNLSNLGKKQLTHRWWPGTHSEALPHLEAELRPGQRWWRQPSHSAQLLLQKAKVRKTYTYMSCTLVPIGELEWWQAWSEVPEGNSYPEWSTDQKLGSPSSSASDWPRRLRQVFPCPSLSFPILLYTRIGLQLDTNW